MRATINTDASYYHDTGAAGYAFWISCDVGRFKKWGKISAKCNDPTYAELFCIANAIHYTVFHPELKGKITKIHINTDSQRSINILERPSKFYNRHKTIMKAVKYIRKITKGIEIRLEHVRSHTGADDKRSYCNSWCDEKSKLGAKL